MAKFKHIYQRRSDDCGIACTAMMLGVAYAKVKRAVDGYFKNVLKKEFDGIDFKDEKAIAAMFGETLRYTWVTRKNRKTIIAHLIGRRATLCVPGMGENPADWHALYWDGERVYDPTPNRGYASDGAYAFKVMTMIGTFADEWNTDSIDFL